MCDSSTAHVRPVDDLVVHDLSEDCVCVPSVERVDCPHGGDGWVVIHHSLDGRELQPA